MTTQGEQLSFFNVQVDRADGALHLALSVRAADADDAKQWVAEKYELAGGEFRLTATRARTNPSWR